MLKKLRRPLLAITSAFMLMLLSPFASAQVSQVSPSSNTADSTVASQRNVNGVRVGTTLFLSGDPKNWWAKLEKTLPPNGCESCQRKWKENPEKQVHKIVFVNYDTPIRAERLDATDFMGSRIAALGITIVVHGTCELQCVRLMLHGRERKFGSHSDLVGETRMLISPPLDKVSGKIEMRWPQMQREAITNHLPPLKQLYTDALNEVLTTTLDKTGRLTVFREKDSVFCRTSTGPCKSYEGMNALTLGLINSASPDEDPLPDSLLLK